MFEAIANWLEQNMSECIYHKYFGVQCFGCGFQRSLVELLRGNFYESLILYPALIPILLSVILIFVQLVFKLPKGILYLKISFIFTFVIIILSYLYKVFTGNIY